jgi:hypothetical protein
MRPRNKVEGELPALARERPSLSRGLSGSVTWPNSINCPSGSRMPRPLAIAALDHPLSWIGPMLRRTVNLSKDRPTRPLTGAILGCHWLPTSKALLGRAMQSSQSSSLPAVCKTAKYTATVIGCPSSDVRDRAPKSWPHLSQKRFSFSGIRAALQYSFFQTLIAASCVTAETSAKPGPSPNGYQHRLK